MVVQFQCPVSVRFPNSNSIVECNSEVTPECIAFSDAKATSIPITPNLYLDKFNQTNGVAICDNNGIQAVIACVHVEKESEFVTAVINALWNCTIRVIPNPTDKSEWHHRVYRGTLHSACVMEDQERLEKIISDTPSFSVDRQDSSGRSPLYYACSHDFKPAVELLVKADADPACQDKEGTTPLHVSSRLGHANTVQFLLKSGTGVIPAEFDSDQNSPLWLAACSDSPRAAACVKVLLEHGFSADILNEGKHLIHVVCIKGNADVAESLLIDGKLDSNVICSEGLSPLHYAVLENTNNDVALVKTLLWAGAYANYPSDDQKNNTPLHVCKQEEIAMTLVSYGARPEMVNALRQTATQQFSDDFVKRLSSTCSVRWKLKREVAILFCPNAPYLDGSSCRLCKYTFLPIIGRKHHCRICGNLVCESCSQKRVTFSSQAYRACDGCFNRAMEARVAFQMVPSTLQAPDTPPNELLPSPEPSPSPQVLIADAPDIDTDLGCARPLTALHERGQALEELGTRSDALRTDAEQFANLAERLAAKFGGGK